MHQECANCSSEITSIPYNCKYCGNKFCSEHRLPENHNCSGNAKSPRMKKRPQPDREKSSTVSTRVSNLWSNVDRYLDGRITYSILGLMWFTFVIQTILISILPQETYAAVFSLSGENIFYVWTWITSIFAHGGFWHIIGNSIGIFFLGRIVERVLSNKNYILLFLGSGIIAGLSQALLSTSGVVGASGALFAILGFITVISPNTKLFIIPIPFPIAIKYITTILVGVTIISIMVGGVSAGGIAQIAHLVGLVIGLLYGTNMKDSIGISDKIDLKI